MLKVSLNELSKENKQLQSNEGLLPLNLLVLSNVTVESSEIPIKNVAYKAGFSTAITYGNYNNIINDSVNAAQHDVTLVIWELANLIEDFLFRGFSFDAPQFEELLAKVKSEIDLCFLNLAKAPLGLVTKFTARHFYGAATASHAFETFVQSLNDHLVSTKPASVSLIDVDDVYSQLGVNDCIDFKLYNLFKSLYTTNFYYQLANLISPVIKRNKGKVKKVLILDCDNTLWKGIIGEDGMDGIDMSINSKKGANFARIQYLIKGLHQRGVLLCICSKNNHADVQEVFNNHPDMLLSADDFVVQKVNWISKAQNIKEIAEELNLGLDSFVFVDDSDFEVNLVRQEVPAVKVYQVPKKAYLYPPLFIELLNDFYNPILTKEDLAKTLSYKQEFERKKLKTNTNNQKDYLTSLGLKMECRLNSLKDVERIAQMTQKTNQFNFTTKRYTVAEIEKMIEAENYNVLSYAVKDKYGDYGITALAILKEDSGTMFIDNLLMSCRIIGRDLEFAIVDTILDYTHGTTTKKVVLSLIHTKKNIVVKEFGEKFGFDLVETTPNSKTYHQSIKDYKPFNLPYIQIKSIGATKNII